MLTQEQIQEILAKRLNQPKQYQVDGEQVVNDSADDVAKLLAMAKQAQSKRRAPFGISVAEGNGTV